MPDYGHYDLICPICGKRMGGCRCPSKDKSQIIGTTPCMECLSAGKIKRELTHDAESEFDVMINVPSSLDRKPN